MRTVTIEVTQDDINRGGTGCDNCPVALAIRREVGEEAVLDVDEHEIAINGYCIKTPDAAADFIAAYDGNLDEDNYYCISPFTFTMEAP